MPNELSPHNIPKKKTLQNIFICEFNQILTTLSPINAKTYYILDFFKINTLPSYLVVVFDVFIWGISQFQGLLKFIPY